MKASHSQRCTNFAKIYVPPQNSDARTFKWSAFHTRDLQILDTATENSAVQASSIQDLCISAYGHVCKELCNQVGESSQPAERNGSYYESKCEHYVMVLCVCVHMSSHPSISSIQPDNISVWRGQQNTGPVYFIPTTNNTAVKAQTWKAETTLVPLT